jgi:citronellol/citronellal dehydrogenase
VPPKTLFITGASRGIGLAIALRAARDGANVAIIAKTTEPHPKLPGTIFTAADEIERAGGKALPLACDIRFEDQVIDAVQKTVERFGGIDACINNASAISLTPTVETDMKRYDLMNGINARGTFLCSKATIPHLARAANPHILNIAPPLDMKARWFTGHVAYTMAKFGMSMCTLGMADELRAQGIAVNSLWPLTTIDTAAVRNLLGGDAAARVARKPEIVADAAHEILARPARECTGNFFIDEEVLREAGVTDFSIYSSDPSVPPVVDIFVPDSAVARTPTRLTANSR